MQQTAPITNMTNNTTVKAIPRATLPGGVVGVGPIRGLEEAIGLGGKDEATWWGEVG
jgi:hypothetical protein